jgi:hypothetical protein
MKRISIFFAVLALSSFIFGQDKSEPTKADTNKPAQAKTMSSKNPVTDVVKEVAERRQTNLLAAVDEMPADKFGWSPTPAQQTFGHLVIHMTMSNIELCSKAANMPPPPMKPMPETDKERLQAGLTKSFMFCQAALKNVDDSKLGDSIELYGGKQATVAFALIALTNDWADHYSAAAMYLRLNGLLPPTAQKK